MRVLEAPPALFTLLGDIAQARPGTKFSIYGPDLASPQVLAAFSKIPPAKGSYSENGTVWPTDTSVPGIKLFDQQISTLDKAAVGNAGALFPWVDAWGAMQVLATMKSGPITAATVSAAMKKTNISFEGVAPSWHYEFNTLGLGCENANDVYLGQYNGGLAVTPLGGDKPVTAISPQIIAYYKKSLSAGAS